MKLHLQFTLYTVDQWYCLYTINTLVSWHQVVNISRTSTAVIFHCWKCYLPFQFLYVKICFVLDLFLSVDKWRKITI